MEYYLVIDFGGSSTKYAIMNEEFEIVEHYVINCFFGSKNEFINSVLNIYKQYNNIKGVAIDMPGIIDPNKRKVSSPYIKEKNIDLAYELQSIINLPVSIINDACAAAYAELNYGKLKDVDNALIMTLGTGVGGVIIIDHKIYHGKSMRAGNLSFINVNYKEPFNKDYILSNRIGKNGLLKKVQKQLDTNQFYSGYEIFEMAKNNPIVMKVLEEYAQEIALQILNLHFVLEFEKVVIGGGISSESILIELINKQIENICHHLGFNPYLPIIESCSNFNDSNLIGSLHYHLYENNT